MGYTNSCNTNCQKPMASGPSCAFPCRNRQMPDNYCPKKEECPKEMMYDFPLAMAYIPWQKWRNVYDAGKGLENGSIFGELVFPFLRANPVCNDCGCNNGRRM